MKHLINGRLFAIALSLCTILGFMTSVVNAAERVVYDQSNFGPYSSRVLVNPTHIVGPGVQESDWYPIYFWRDPSYLPDDHDLLSNLAPSDPTGILHNFYAPLTFDGFGIFPDGYTPTSAPQMSKHNGNYVPVYFVPISAFNPGMTLLDLYNLVGEGCALAGTADQYNEVLQVDAQIPKFNISLKGTLNDETRFSVITVGQSVPEYAPFVALRIFTIKGLPEVDLDTCSP